MKLIGIDIGKNKHFFCVMDQQTGEIISQPVSFSNDKEGFDFLVQKIKSYPKDSILIGMEDTGHYHFALLKYLLDLQYTVALINPKTTDFNRKMQGGITKNDKLDTINICDVLDTPERKKQYRITKVNSFDLYEQKQLTRHHHNLKEEENVYKNRLQKCIDIVFPEFNKLFNSKYGIVYMNILKMFGSAENIANTDIRTIRKCFEIEGRGNRISLTPERLKECARSSIGLINQTCKLILHTAVGVFICDIKLKFVCNGGYINAHFEKSFFRKEDVVGKKASEIFPESMPEFLHFTKMSCGKQGYHFPLLFQTDRHLL